MLIFYFTYCLNFKTRINLNFKIFALFSIFYCLLIHIAIYLGMLKLFLMLLDIKCISYVVNKTYFIYTVIIIKDLLIFFKIKGVLLESPSTHIYYLISKWVISIINVFEQNCEVIIKSICLSVFLPVSPFSDSRKYTRLT